MSTCRTDGTTPCSQNQRARSATRTPPYDEPVSDSPAPPRTTDADRPLSALPSRGARALAFVSILVGGLAGGLIGHGLVDVQCDGDCGLARGLGIMLGALPAAGGTAVVAVLALRALGEWREMADRA